MSKKQWYLRIGGALFVVLAWVLAISGNIIGAVMACNCIIMIATLEDRNMEEGKLRGQLIARGLLCTGCNELIDPLVCWCGVSMGEHHLAEHTAVPMGCNCHNRPWPRG